VKSILEFRNGFSWSENKLIFLGNLMRTWLERDQGGCCFPLGAPMGIRGKHKMFYWQWQTTFNINKKVTSL
jgi:hypothetical protein